MIHDEHPNDRVLIQELRDSLADLTMRERPSLEAIVARGRRHRRRRRSGVASLSLVAVAALALGVAGLRSAGLRGSTPKPSPHATRRTIRTAAFTLVSYKNGTAKLALTNSQVFDPPELRRALAKDGIPALVTTAVYCSSDPAPPDATGIGVVGTRPPLISRGIPAGHLQKLYRQHTPPPNLGRLINDTVTVINPAKMPSGTELAIDYAPGQHLLNIGLVYTNSHTCRSGPPPTQ